MSGSPAGLTGRTYWPDLLAAGQRGQYVLMPAVGTEVETEGGKRGGKEMGEGESDVGDVVLEPSELPVDVLAEIARATAAQLPLFVFAVAPDKADIATAGEESVPYLLMDRRFVAAANAAFREGRAMARSTYIYVVLNDEGVPYTAFTVKHELVSYLRTLGPAVDHLAGVIRLRDGADDRATSLKIKELLA